MRLKERELNKQNSGNVNKNRMRERARHNKHTHTPEKINIGETVDLKTHTYYLCIRVFFQKKKKRKYPAAQKYISKERLNGGSEGSTQALVTNRKLVAAATTGKTPGPTRKSDACFW